MPNVPALTLITPTCDQPTGFALCERFMASQTIQGVVPLQWIVVDDGEVPIEATMGQQYLRRHRGTDSPSMSFCKNLLEAIPAVRGTFVAIIEHDDYYAPNHLGVLLNQLDNPAIVIAGDDQQRYYNVEKRMWRIFDNRGASLCQTAFHRVLLPEFERVVVHHLDKNHYGVDGAFWALFDYGRSLYRSNTCVGIKGLPGRVGLGIGHRPHGGGWKADPDLSMLRSWIQDDADLYAGMPIAGLSKPA